MSRILQMLVVKAQTGKYYTSSVKVIVSEHPGSIPTSWYSEKCLPQFPESCCSDSDFFSFC